MLKRVVALKIELLSSCSMFYVILKGLSSWNLIELIVNLSFNKDFKINDVSANAVVDVHDISRNVFIRIERQYKSYLLSLITTIVIAIVKRHR